MISANDTVLRHAKKKANECKVVPVDAMKTWGMEAWRPSFLTTTLDGGGWSASRPGRFLPVKRAYIAD
jgi:hypothetical protein